MDVMILVSTRDSGPLVKGLMAALGRTGASWGCFFTNDGVALAGDSEVVALLGASQWANVCEHSWDKFGDGPCPVELGSQTQNSMMMGDAARVVSL